MSRESIISSLTELPKSCMGFVTKSGETLFIHEEDVRNIAMQIVIEGSMKKCVAIVKEADQSVHKADMLYGILKSEKDMKPELRNRYLKQISELLGNGDIVLTNCSSEGEVVKIIDDPTSDTFLKSMETKK